MDATAVVDTEPLSAVVVTSTQSESSEHLESVQAAHR
jgi:hypothetical protein